MEKEQKQVVVANVGSVLRENIFADIDFSLLDNAIENIGNHSSNLTDGEKEMAVEIVNTWEEKVIDRLHDKRYDLSQLKHFLSIPTSEDDLFDATEYLELESVLAAQTSTEHLYKILVAARDELEAHTKKEPLPPIVEHNTVVEVDIQQTHSFYAELQIFENKSNALSRKILIAEKNWKTALADNSSIKHILNLVHTKLGEIKKLILTSSEKSSVAKIQIAIPDEEVRNNLKAMFDFSKSI